MSKSGIKSKVAKELSKIKGKTRVYLFISKPEKVQEVNQAVVGFFTNTKKLNGVYATLSMPYKQISSDFKEKGIKTDRLHFIDGSGSSAPAKTKNCEFLSSGKSLTELSIAITNVVNKQGLDFLFIDSLSTVLIYNNQEITEKFFHFIVNKIRNMDKLLTAMTIDEEKSKKIIPVISQFCDKTIRI